MTPQIEFDEYLYFLEGNRLYGKGIGIIDLHLLASAKLAQTRLWTLDKKLKSAAIELEINYKKIQITKRLS